ncbi:MAG: hypothetical protein QW292_07060 [Candidatus Parvarchaeota archaeon]
MFERMTSKSELEEMLLKEAKNLVSSPLHNKIQVWLGNVMIKTKDGVSSIKLEDKLKSEHFISKTWPADITLEYESGGKKIFEVIEVETIPLSRVHSRSKNIGGKAARSMMAAISDGRFRYESPKGDRFRFDEFYFSVCLNATGLNYLDVERSMEFRGRLEEFADDTYINMAKELQSKGINSSPRGFKLHNIYVILDSHALESDDYSRLMNRGRFYLYRSIMFPIRPVFRLDGREDVSPDKINNMSGGSSAPQKQDESGQQNDSEGMPQLNKAYSKTDAPI